MKHIICISIFLLSALYSNAQGYAIGANSQFSNSNQTQQVDYTTTPPAYPTNSQTINVSLFIERIDSSGMYYRLTAGIIQTSSTTLYQNTDISYFGNTYIVTKIYSPELKSQMVSASFGIGKIFSYKRLSLRVGAALNYYRYQTETSDGTAIIDNTTYSTINSHTSYTPYNEYLLSCYAAMHYTVWKGLSVGVQMDNGLDYITKNQTTTVTSDGYGVGGTLVNSNSVSSNVNYKTISTYFLLPSISIIYTFNKRKIN